MNRTRFLNVSVPILFGWLLEFCALQLPWSPPQVLLAGIGGVWLTVGALRARTSVD